MNHSVFISEQATSVSTPIVAESGVPFVVGLAPVQSAISPGKAGVPVLCTSWTEAVEKLGYSDNWEDYTLCEFMYSHFKLFGCQPAVFCNVLDISSMKESAAAADVELSDHKAKLPIEAIDDARLVLKASGATGAAYVKGTDYSTYYDGEHLVIEVLAGGACYDAETISAAYNKVTPSSVNAVNIAAAMESIELCMTTLGVVPDLICAPRFSSESTVAAVMATKAGSINGMFKAKALIDISSKEGGAESYTEAISLKKANNFIDTNEILSWPMLKLGDYTFHMSTQQAGLMAQVDSNNGCPYESPSNKAFRCDAMVLEDGSEVNLTLEQANMLNFNGIGTALNFMGGWMCWGNYTACYPASTDVKDYFIPVSRMFGWIGNSLVRSFWSKLDKPMNRRLIDTILDSANIWLNGLAGAGYLLGARAEMLESENPETSLMAGVIKIHIYMTPPSPAQEIEFVLEYDAEYVASALQP
ncbi:phage tail sheath family protein [Anaeromassilibacillus senegalensis]|uniref:phage tail sheath family protein n=1 Tax=Anaeromassilibacillus senegalensis TaxID=1673717 RepID=UPI000681C1C1|nr:phage tail protein [Anaeromassilibacillus senegalensis]